MEKGVVYFCDASVVSSPKRNLVLTAAQCLTGADELTGLAFVPKVRKNADSKLDAPYGKFPIKRDGGQPQVYVDSRYRAESPQQTARFGAAFAVTDKNLADGNVEDAIGGNRLLTDAGFAHKGVRVPSRPGPGAPADVCEGDTSQAAFKGWAGSYLRVNCTHSTTAPAGAPFIANYNAATRTGDVIGVVGGHAPAEAGDRSTYSPYFGGDVKALFETALRGGTAAGPSSPATPPAPSPSSPSAPVPSTPSTPTPTLTPTEDQLRATPEQIAEAKAAEAYWTPERIAGAVPVKQDRQSKTSSSPGRSAGLFSPSHPDPNGVATVGVFLIQSDDDPQSDPGKRDQFCSASVVASPTKSLVISAGHCLNDNDRFKSLAFAPGWKPDPNRPGLGMAPYGVFPVPKGKIWIDGRYLSQGTVKADDLDFAIVKTGPNSKGVFLENATGMGNELTTLHSSQLAQKNVTLIGFPGGAKTPLVCPNATTRAYDGRFLEIPCKGFAGGVSGGPFIRNFDGKRGDVIGVIGGYKTGGTSDDISYSSQFDADVVRLYNQAVNDYTPDKSSRSEMGDGELWRHAVAAASGSFHTESQKFGDSDLVVKWTDGEVTLYPGDQNQSFHVGCKPDSPCETQLAKPNEMWEKYADVITAGDFAGSNAYDLMVKWVDGEVTIYKDIDQNTKLPTSLDEHPANEIKIAEKDSIWKYAKGIATGKYGGNKWPDDLVVRWSDGEVTKYTDVDDKGFHAEAQMAAPNDRWKNADLITGGDFDGDTTDAKPNHDLFVKWTNGTLSMFQDINASGLGAESTVATKEGPDLWTHARVITAGEFGSNDWEDDLFVRWSDGEVTMYGNTQADQMGREYTLVPPKPAGFASSPEAGRGTDNCRTECGPGLFRRTH
ncbi:hypothetical protein ACFXKR_17990 [Streptomyces violascens]|uniref:hypothetical protein n=1 Tax=Streptomyces violascens TaxID=67381 RepID=UPI003680E1C4